MTENLPPLPSHPEHGWVWTEAEQREPQTGEAVGPRLELPVGRLEPERAALLRQLTNAQREVRTWPEWMTAHATMPRWMLEWDDHA